MSTPEGLRVEVLGPLRAWRSATEIPLGPPRQRAVFAALAVRAGRVVGRGELIAAVWGESAPASAEGNLHTYVSHLRRALDPARPHRGSASLITSDATGYTLRVRESDVDLMVFEQACAAAARNAADFASVVESLDVALGLWRGDALSGVPGPLAESERERLAQLRLAAVEQRAAAALALGGHRELCPELAGLVREHPVRESLRELLLLALYRSGRHTEALDVFRAARQDLVRELGIEPGEGLRRLHEQVLAFDPELDLPAEPVRRPGGFVTAPPAQARRALDHAAAGTFVGRAAEVERSSHVIERSYCCVHAASMGAPPGRSTLLAGRSEIGVNLLGDPDRALHRRRCRHHKQGVSGIRVGQLHSIGGRRNSQRDVAAAIVGDVARRR